MAFHTRSHKEIFHETPLPPPHRGRVRCRCLHDPGRRVAARPRATCSLFRGGRGRHGRVRCRAGFDARATTRSYGGRGAAGVRCRAGFDAHAAWRSGGRAAVDNGGERHADAAWRSGGRAAVDNGRRRSNRTGCSSWSRHHDACNIDHDFDHEHGYPTQRSGDHLPSTAGDAHGAATRAVGSLKDASTWPMSPPNTQNRSMDL